MRKARKLFATTVVLFVSISAAMRAQSVLDGFDPNVNGAVYVVVVQPDGKILIGGSFTSVLGVQRHNIARLHPDGTLDSAFDPSMANNGTIYAIAVQADGKVLAGGNFFSIGGQPRNYIARLDANTGLADSWNPNASGEVYSVAVQADGKILVGGVFSGVGGQTRNRLARLDALTGLADSFNPNANNNVLVITVQADGKILAGGDFNAIGGQTRNNIARLDAATGLADSFDPNANSAVHSIVVQADGKILAGGTFNSIGGQTRNWIARLDATTGLADSFNPNPTNGNTVMSIAVQADGKILAGGSFTTIGGQPRNYIARLDPTTGLADSFNPSTNSIVHSIAVQADRKILAGGAFTALTPNSGSAVTRNNIARLETDGRLDQTLNLGIVGFAVFATAVQADGKILVGGGFNSIDGQIRNSIARFNPDGTLDTAFNPNATSGVWSIAVQTDGKILVGGAFTSIGGQPRNRIARLNPDGTLDTSFNPNANNRIVSIAMQADGRILVAGEFSNIGGQTRNRIARLDAATGLADSFNPDASCCIVYPIAVQADGKILAGGTFTTIGGQPRNNIARLDATTGLADSFDPNADDSTFAIAVQPDGKILVGGGFTSIGGQTRHGIARLDAEAGLADSFDPDASSAVANGVNSIALQADGKILAGGYFEHVGGQPRSYIARLDVTTGLADSFTANANNYVFSIALQEDGKILAGGFFNGIGGQPRSAFARLSNKSAALQNLAVAQTTMTWTRGGSSPQFTRVTFEHSTDNVTYTLLGTGTAADSNWTLTGLNVPTGQNIYIRARGYYRSGLANASESITESVQNAFIVAPTPTPTPSPAPPNTVGISGAISYCSNPTLGPVPNVTLTLTGSASDTAISDSSGNYAFTSLAAGVSYTLTPTKRALTPGAAGINTVDVIVTRLHFFNPFLSGCRLIAADVNGDGMVNTIDVIAIQKFLLGLSTGIAKVGKYQFSPASRTYVGVVSDQTTQNYATLAFGDVSDPFAQP